MNIFFLNPPPEPYGPPMQPIRRAYVFYGMAKLNAGDMVDKHVVKMILEYGQMLSTAHRVLDGEHKIIQKKRKVHYYELGSTLEAYIPKATHVNHPCSKWVRENSNNYLFVFYSFKA